MDARLLIPLACAGALLLAGPVAAATAGGGAAYPSPSGGTEFGTPVAEPVLPRPVVRTFSVSPTSVREGSLPTVRFRIDEPGVKRVQVRVAIVPVGGAGTTLSVPQGNRRTGRPQRASFPRGTRLAAGTYLVRLHARDARGKTLLRRARASGRANLTVVAAPAAKPVAPAPVVATPVVPVGSTGVFPVVGVWVFGGEGAGFGADRGSHKHEGQDIMAAKGLPVVAPMSGVITVRAVQPEGAGHYLVMRATDGREFFFAHLVADSTLVKVGETVTAGQRLADVGNTGRSSGAHLHFEIWEGGWRRGDGHPVDPLPQLKAWAK